MNPPFMAAEGSRLRYLVSGSRFNKLNKKHYNSSYLWHTNKLKAQYFREKKNSSLQLILGIWSTQPHNPPAVFTD